MSQYEQVGRQVNFHLHPDDLRVFEDYFWSTGDVTALSQPHPTAELVEVSSLRVVRRPGIWPILFLARRQDLGSVEVKHVQAQGYFVVDFLASPVVEFSPGIEFSADGRPDSAIGTGRIWYPTGYWRAGVYEQMPDGFLKWADRSLKWIRRNWRRGDDGLYCSPTVG